MTKREKTKIIIIIIIIIIYFALIDKTKQEVKAHQSETVSECGSKQWCVT